MWTNFVNQLQNIQTERNTTIAVMLNPQFEQLPLPITRFDDPFFPFGKEIITATRDMTCAYIFDLAAYMAMGAAGMRALERTIRFVGDNTMTILHGPFTGTGYSPMADKIAFGVDAITITRRVDQQYYLENPPHAALLMCDDTPCEDTQNGGYYWQQQQRIIVKQNDIRLTLQVTTDNELYASRLDDYAEATRDAIKALR